MRGCLVFSQKILFALFSSLVEFLGPNMLRLLVCAAACLSFCTTGCVDQPTDRENAQSSEAVAVPYQPAQVELGTPTAFFQAPDIVRFEVPYKFVVGAPVAHYGCEVKFLDSGFTGQKHMQAWELKPEGVIRDGFVIGSEPTGAFEIVFTEAESPDQGYHPISKVVTGHVGKAQ